ncbi:MAG TPA: DUF4384 domain-containing protein [Trueperaceae bacterium]
MRTIRLPFVQAIAACGLLLSACTITITPSPGVQITLSDEITDFRPTMGVGHTYRVGDRIEFLITTRRAGYVTLTAIDPDGTVYLLSRNVYVPGGSVVLPTREQRVVYNAAPPRGLHRVRASFTGEPTSGTVVYRGRRGDAEWSAAIELELRSYQVRDVAETHLYIY